MPRWMLTVFLCVVLSSPALAQEEGESAEEPPAEAPPAEAPPAEAAPAAAEEAPAAAEEAPAEEALPDVSALSWEEAWDGGFALYRAGQYAKATAYLERALELEPADPTVRAYLADCYSRTGDAARAAELSQPLTEPEPEPEMAPAQAVPAEEQPAAADTAWPSRSYRRPHHDPPGSGPMAQSVRKGKHFGMGLTLGGNALSAGVYFEGLPVRFLAVEGGLGLGDVHTFFWWLQAAVLPLDMPLSPAVGVGVLGTMGLDFHYQSSSHRGNLEYYMNRVNPYIHAGVVLVTRPGFTAAFDINGVITGDPSFPLAPWVGLRLGFLL
jgi:hypothetical protein